MWIRKGSRSNMNQDYRCTICHGDGMYLKDNTAIFCECADGQRRKRLWYEAGELVKAEAEQAQRARERRPRRYTKQDYKAEGAGEREPGEEG